MNGKQSVMSNGELLNCFKREETNAAEFEVGQDNEMIGEKVNPEEHANWGAVPSEQVPNDHDGSGGQESGAEASEKHSKAEGSHSSGKSKRKQKKAEIEGASPGYTGRRPTNNGIFKNKKLN